MSLPNNYQPATSLLKDRVILVTGAGDGIGKATAKLYAQHGATVVLTGRTSHKLEAVYDEIVANGDNEPAIFPLDLSTAKHEDFLGLAGGINQEFGRLDGLLNNAAELGTLTPIDHYPYDLLQRVLTVNLEAPFVLTQACLPLLRQATDAAILFSSTEPYEKSSAYWGAYGISKQGLDAFMLILADELENNTHIRVNSINPGPVRTRLRNLAYPAEDMSNLVMPDDVALHYLYMMSPDSQGLHGQIIEAQTRK
ncbi:MAG: YciK family oxidoreductase [Sulfuriflexus sp.]|nr:YciK family oxidoreductase [Sulfuriflexus sp.]